MSTIDKSRFAQTMTVTRLAKTELDEHGQSRRWGAKRFKPNQIVLESDDLPCAPQIDALIERAGRLSLKEAASLVPAWEMVGSVSLDEARVAVQIAGKFSSGGTPVGSEMFVPWEVAWVAVRTVSALVYRDLIDEATPRNQAAYDRETSPWRRIIGPIHPGDEAIR